MIVVYWLKIVVTWHLATRTGKDTCLRAQLMTSPVIRIGRELQLTNLGIIDGSVEDASKDSTAGIKKSTKKYALKDTWELRE